jgi:hypothetical protein
MRKTQKFTGGSPKFAIPKHIAEIALKYGETVSKGIVEMERKIQMSK